MGRSGSNVKSRSKHVAGSALRVHLRDGKKPLDKFPFELARPRDHSSTYKFATRNVIWESGVEGKASEQIPVATKGGIADQLVANS